MSVIKIQENIYWVGAIDWNLRNFHGYATWQGSTYNAYLIIDEKITLIDTAKSEFSSCVLERISEIINPSKINYIISNHSEMDHSGSLPQLIKIAQNATVITSPAGAQNLKSHFHQNWQIRIAGNNEVLKLGKNNLKFIWIPMVHWPDSMLTYALEQNLLFSNDVFGQHLASTERFDDEFSLSVILKEAQKYYANIILPFSQSAKKALEALRDLRFAMIAPSHGIIWRSYIPKIIQAYKNWSENKTEKKAVIIYDTMWNSTEKIALAISEAFAKKNIGVKLFSLKHNHISDIMTELLCAQYICVGSPTLNNNFLPSVSSFLIYLKGLAPEKRIALAFGSFGWSGQSVNQITEVLKECGFELLEQIKTQWVPDKNQLTSITNNLKEKLP